MMHVLRAVEMMFEKWEVGKDKICETLWGNLQLYIDRQGREVGIDEVCEYF